MNTPDPDVDARRARRVSTVQSSVSADETAALMSFGSQVGGF